MNRSMRVFFKKTGGAKYISHLDLQRTMQRALKRARLPVWETEGFNPHIYLTFALPLSLGVESLCESFDIKMTEEINGDEIRAKLNVALCPDMAVIKAAEPVRKPTEIQKAQYEIVCDTRKFHEILGQNEIIINKKTKKGQAQVDIKPMIELKETSENKVTLILPAGGNLNLNPLAVIGACEGLKAAGITRTAIFCADGEVFN